MQPNLNEADEIYKKNSILNGQFPNGLEVLLPKGLVIDPNKKYRAVIEEVPDPSSYSDKNIQRESTERMESKY